MKVLLSTAMALGLILSAGMNHGSEAAAAQPITLLTHQDELIQARFPSYDSSFPKPLSGQRHWMHQQHYPWPLQRPNPPPHAGHHRHHGHHHGQEGQHGHQNGQHQEHH